MKTCAASGAKDAVSTLAARSFRFVVWGLLGFGLGPLGFGFGASWVWVWGLLGFGLGPLGFWFGGV